MDKSVNPSSFHLSERSKKKKKMGGEDTVGAAGKKNASFYVDNTHEFPTNIGSAVPLRSSCSTLNVWCLPQHFTSPRGGGGADRYLDATSAMLVGKGWSGEVESSNK